jgi:hypothetical protein
VLNARDRTDLTEQFQGQPPSGYAPAGALRGAGRFRGARTAPAVERAFVHACTDHKVKGKTPSACTAFIAW